MTSSRRTALIFAFLWGLLAVLQASRTARVCFDATPASLVQWGLQFALLGAPLVHVCRDAGIRQKDLDVRSALALILLTYVPVTIALHIAETCGRR